MKINYLTFVTLSFPFFLTQIQAQESVNLPAKLQEWGSSVILFDKGVFLRWNECTLAQEFNNL